jgi:hypothetical protein
MASYSDQRKAEALAVLTANGGNLSRTARDTGVPISTLQLWRDRGVHPEVTEICNHVKETLADRIEALLGVIVGEMLKKADTAKFSELAFGADKAAHVMQLLRGAPTSISENRQEVTEDERANRISEILGQGEDRSGAVRTDRRRTGGNRPPANGAVH